MLYAGDVAVVGKALVDEVLLIKLIHHGEIALEAREIAVFAEPAQADGMEGAQVHFIEVEADTELVKAGGDASDQLAGGFVGEGDDKKRFGSGVLFQDEVDDAFNKRERFAGAGAGDDEKRPVRGSDGLELGRVGSIGLVVCAHLPHQD